jgi:general secretion pathway protein B
MSFILDALKKSEGERQRQSGPGVFQPRVASPRARLPLWALALGALLGVNLLVLIWLVTRPDAAPPASAALDASTQRSATAAVPVAMPPSAVDPPAPAPRAAAATAPGPAIGAATPFNPPLIVEPSLRTPATAAGAPGAVAPNPNDFLPAQPPAIGDSGAPTPAGGVVASAATGSVATRESLLARGQQVPEAALSLHVYDPAPSRRFVFVNGQRAVEGDALPGGLRVEQIVPEGVILAWNGNRFLVPLP